MGKQAKWKEFSKEELKKIVDESMSVAEVAEKLGYARTGGGSAQSINNMIAYYNFDTSHFTGQNWNKGVFDYERFKYGNAIKTANMKDAIIALRGHKCECCGLEEWQGQPIPLEVHHKDGDHLNNELDNLSLNCPNCHALTENYRGKNIGNSKKKDPVSDEQFVEALKTNSSIRQALISLGLTGAGGNYDRAYTLIQQYNILHLKK